MQMGVVVRQELMVNKLSTAYRRYLKQTCFADLHCSILEMKFYTKLIGRINSASF